MVGERGRDLHALVGRDRAALGKVVDVHERRGRGQAFIRDPYVDVGCIHLEEADVKNCFVES